MPVVFGCLHTLKCLIFVCREEKHTHTHTHTNQVSIWFRQWLICEVISDHCWVQKGWLRPWLNSFVWCLPDVQESVSWCNWGGLKLLAIALNLWVKINALYYTLCRISAIKLNLPGNTKNTQIHKINLRLMHYILWQISAVQKCTKNKYKNTI